MHTPTHPPDIGLEGLFVIVELLIKSVLIEFIITLLPKRLSIVFEGSILFYPLLLREA